MTAAAGNMKINPDRLWDSLMEMAKIGPGVVPPGTASEAVSLP